MKPVCPVCCNEVISPKKYCNRKCFFNHRNRQKIKELIKEQEIAYEQPVVKKEVSIFSVLVSLFIQGFKLAALMILLLIGLVIGLWVHPLLLFILVGVFGGYFLYRLFKDF